MIVILEGMERTGKSTLAKIFESKGFVNFKDKVHNEDFSSNAMLNRYSALINMLMALNNKGVNIVIDRFHISDLVYRKVYRSDQSISTHDFFVDDILASLNASLILCERTIDDDYIKQYPKNRSIDKIDLLKNSFEYYFDKSSIKNKFRFDLSSVHLFNFINNIVGYDCKYDFYLASPFFNESQKERENEVKTILRSYNYNVYAPMEHGIVGSLSSHSFVKNIFDSNIEAIKNSKYVLAITDEKDMGTIWEAGYAYGIGKPVIYVAVTLEDKPFNIMLSESGIGIFKSYDSLKISANRNNWGFKEDVKYE